MSKQVGYVDFDDRAQKGEFLARAAELEGEYVVEFKNFARMRSLQANKFYHAAIVEPIRAYLSDHGQDCDHDAVHEMLKGHFLGYTDVVDPQTGEVLASVPRTTRLPSDAFSQYIDHIQEWAMDRGIDMRTAADRAKEFYAECEAKYGTVGIDEQPSNTSVASAVQPSEMTTGAEMLM